MNRFRLLVVVTLWLGVGGASAQAGATSIDQGPSAAQPAATNSASLPPNNLIIPPHYVTMQTRIFVPNTRPYDKGNWAETVMGQIIAPTVASTPELAWYWFSRYVQPAVGGETNDTDISKLSEAYYMSDPAGSNKFHRSVRFRFCLPEKDLAKMESVAEALIRKQGCMIADWRDWDITYDCGGDRFIGENVTPARRAERAIRIVRFYHATSDLMLHNLVGPNQGGYFRMENNPDSALGSSFESIHHLFCNMTEVPLCVVVTTDGDKVNVGTLTYPPPPSLRSLGSVRVRF